MKPQHLKGQYEKGKCKSETRGQSMGLHILLLADISFNVMITEFIFYLTHAVKEFFGTKLCLKYIHLAFNNVSFDLKFPK